MIAKLSRFIASLDWKWGVEKTMVPISIAFAGIVGTYIVNSGIKQQETNAKVLEMSINLLSEPEASPNSRHRREWALQILEKYTPVALPHAAREEILSTGLNPSRVVVTKTAEDGTCFRMEFIPIPGSGTRLINATVIAVTEEGFPAVVAETRQDTALGDQSFELVSSGWRFRATAATSWSGVTGSGDVMVHVSPSTE